MCKWVLLIRPAGRSNWTDQLDRPAGQISWTDLLDGPVLFNWSLGQFAYSKIDLSVCTLSQLPSPTKALFIRIKSYIIFVIIILLHLAPIIYFPRAIFSISYLFFCVLLASKDHPLWFKVLKIMSMLAEKCRAIIIIGQNDVKCHPKCWNCLENNRDNLFGLVMGHSQCDMRIVQF